jgi:hypothetical protein
VLDGRLNYLSSTLFGGASQPEPLGMPYSGDPVIISLAKKDPHGGIHVATIQGQREGWFNPDQYSNPASM